MQKVRVAFRLDSGVDAGFGHAKRCIVLADAFAAAGCEVRFVCATSTDSLFNLAECSRHEVIWIDRPAYRDPATSPALADARQTCRALSAAGFVPDIAVMDHYGLDAEWEQEVGLVAKKVVVLEDYPERLHAADFIIAFSRKLVRQPIALSGGPTTFLDGPQHLLLAPDYPVTQPVRMRDSALDLLLFFGSSDPTGEIGKFLACCTDRDCSGQDLLRTVHIVIGACHPGIDAIRQMTARLPFCRLSVQLPSLSAALAEADVVLTAGGQSMIEAAAMAKPTIAIATARNQVELCQELGELPLIRYLGPHNLVTGSQMMQAIREMPQFFNDRILPVRSARPFEMHGPERIVAAILASIRPCAKPA